MNDFGQRLFGYGEEELIGRSVLDLIVPDTEEASGRDLVAMIQDILRQPERYEHNENENLARDGRRLGSRGATRRSSARGASWSRSSRRHRHHRSQAREKRCARRGALPRARRARHLTGLYNTRYLYQELEALLRRAAQPARRCRSCSSIWTASTAGRLARTL